MATIVAVLCLLMGACTAVREAADGSRSPGVNDTDRGGSTDCPNLTTDWTELAFVPSEERTPGWIDRAREELASDRETIVSYGADHPDEFAGVWNASASDPPVRLVAAFADHVAQHCQQLRRLVEHPNRFEPVMRSHTVAQRRQIRSELNHLAESDEHIEALGNGADHVAVDLRADGEQLATRLKKQYGDAVQVLVGGVPYPPSEIPSDAVVCTVPETVVWPAGVSASLALADDTLPQGGHTNGSVTIVNSSAEPFAIEVDEPSLGWVFRAGDPAPVGHPGVIYTATGAHPVADRALELPPGGTARVSVAVGTASCDPTSGYAVPPGEYEVSAQLGTDPGPVRLSAPAPLRVVDR